MPVRRSGAVGHQAALDCEEVSEVGGPEVCIYKPSGVPPKFLSSPATLVQQANTSNL